MELVALVGWIATAFGISFAWPQAVRSVRATSLRGISATAQCLMLVTAGSWALYGLALGDPIMMVANVAAGLAVLVTSVQLLRRQLLAPMRLLGVVALWAGVLTALWLAVGGVAPGILGALLGALMTLPQAAGLRRGVVPEGVAPATYALLAATMTCWLLYGVLTRDPVVMFPNIVAIPVVLSVWVMLRRASSPATAPADVIVEVVVP